MIYDYENLKTVNILLPNSTTINFVVLFNGRPINTNKQLNSEIALMKNIIPVTSFISSLIRDAYYLLNTFAFSYFVVSLISFYNITLLYYFLHISTLPGFVRMFVLSLAYIFYSRGSVLDMIQRFDWILDNFQPDFSDTGIL